MSPNDPDRSGYETAMQVRNVRWIGISTENYAAMREMLEVVMGLRLNFEEPTTVEFVTSEGDEVQLMAPGDPYFDFFRDHARGPVPLFEPCSGLTMSLRFRLTECVRSR
jgi:hypothetical protein